MKYKRDFTIGMVAGLLLAVLTLFALPVQVLGQVAPTVTNSAADDITETTATLHGEITATGGENATNRGFEWDTDSGAPYANDWDEAGDFGTGVFEHGITGLPPDTTIYWRAYATNSGGTGYSGELSFDTLTPLPLAPTAFTITQTDIDEVTLTWTTGTYADTTIVRVSEDGYPPTVTDGYEVYDGALETATLDGLNLTTSTYYFRAWSENATGYSVDYAEGELGGEMILQIGIMGLLGFLGFGFIVLAEVAKKRYLGWGATGCFAILGVIFYGMAESTSDLYFYLFLLCLALALVSAVIPLAGRKGEREEGLEEDDEDLADVRETMAEADREQNRYSFLYNRRRKPKSQRRLTPYDKTGVH